MVKPRHSEDVSFQNNSDDSDSNDDSSAEEISHASINQHIKENNSDEEDSEGVPDLINRCCSSSDDDEVNHVFHPNLNKNKNSIIDEVNNKNALLNTHDESSSDEDSLDEMPDSLTGNYFSSDKEQDINIAPCLNCDNEPLNDCNDVSQQINNVRHCTMSNKQLKQMAEDIIESNKNLDKIYMNDDDNQDVPELINDFYNDADSSDDEHPEPDFIGVAMSSTLQTVHNMNNNVNNEDFHHQDFCETSKVTAAKINVKGIDE